MAPVISILIPTRARYDQLHQAMASIKATCPNRDLIEVVIRKQTDDAIMQKWQDVSGLNPVVFTGEPMQGYESLNEFYQECANHASGRWVMIFSDDTQFEGVGWVEHLEKVPCWGHIVYPWTITNNASVYHKAGCGPVPIVPNGCWNFYGWKLGNPIDTWLHTQLHSKGWTDYFIPDMKVIHTWNPRPA